MLDCGTVCNKCVCLFETPNECNIMHEMGIVPCEHTVLQKNKLKYIYSYSFYKSVGFFFQVACPYLSLIEKVCINENCEQIQLLSRMSALEVFIFQESAVYLLITYF